MRLIPKLIPKLMLVLSLCTGIGCTPKSNPDPTDANVIQQKRDIQALIDDLVQADPSVLGIVVAVDTPEYAFSAASGVFDTVSQRKLRIDDLFRAASVTKTFTAAALFRLAEEQKVDLERSIDTYLTPESVAILLDGGYDPEQITVLQLLNHTAGIFDYTETDSFYEIIDADPTHQWSRKEQLQLAMDEGEILNQAGEEYHYGDTHYILAAEIIEQVTQLGLAESFRSVLQFERFGLVDTFLETLENPPQEDSLTRLSHPYLEDEDTRGWHPSWDLFGGGGLVTSVADLIRFYQALFDDTGAGIFADPATLQDMLEMPEVGHEQYFGIDGGYGINRFILDDGSPCYGAFGFFSTMLIYCPEQEIYIAATENQSDPQNPDALLDGILEILLP